MDALLLLGLGAGALWLLNRPKTPEITPIVPSVTYPVDTFEPPTVHAQPITLPYLPPSIPAVSPVAPAAPDVSPQIIEAPTAPAAPMQAIFTPVAPAVSEPVVSEPVVSPPIAPAGYELEPGIMPQDPIIQAVIEDQQIRDTSPQIYIPKMDIAFGPPIDRQTHENTLEYYLDLIPQVLNLAHQAQLEQWIRSAYTLGYTENEIRHRVKQQAFALMLMELTAQYGEDALENMPEEMLFTPEEVNDIATAVLQRGTFAAMGRNNNVMLWPGDQVPENAYLIHFATNLDFPPALLFYDPLNKIIQGRNVETRRITSEILQAMRTIGLNI